MRRTELKINVRSRGFEVRFNFLAWRELGMGDVVGGLGGVGFFTVVFILVFSWYLFILLFKYLWRIYDIFVFFREGGRW